MHQNLKLDYLLYISDPLLCSSIFMEFLKILKCSLFYIQDAVALVQDIADAEEASRKLIQEAFARGSSDNITCVVVQFGISE